MIPQNWNADHAEVAARTWTGKCTITAPGGNDDVTVGADLTVDTGTTPSTSPETACRVQQLSPKETQILIADQKVTGVGYLVVVDRSHAVALNSVITITASDDTSLTGCTLTVVKIGRGTELWERDLYAIEDQSAPEAA